MAEHDLQSFLQKIEQLNQLVHLIDSEPMKRAELVECSTHDQVIRLTEKWGFNISKRWGETYRDKSLATNNFLGRSLLQSAKKNNGILLKTTGFRLEYIYLNSNTTPADQLNRYDESAWLLVVQGNILIQIEGEENFYDLNVGDNLLITRHHHYHIIQTDLAPETICLGLFWSLHD